MKGFFHQVFFNLKISLCPQSWKDRFCNARWDNQDDVWFSNKISTLVQYLESHGEVAFVHHDANVINEQNAILYDSVWKHEKRMVNSVHH